MINFLTLYMPQKIMIFCHLFFLQILLFKKVPSVSNSLDPDQAQHFVKSDPGPNCLLKLWADNNGR